MDKLPFRNKENAPVRTYRGRAFKYYRRYKKQLRKDFKARCGYTNCPDHWFGGIDTFHIDHFKPQSTHPQLKTKYTNLVYCCSYVNRAKNNDEGPYLDPCDEDYNKHFYRNAEGKIIPFSSSDSAVYMSKKLKLYLKRYSIIWKLEQLEKRMDKLKELTEIPDDDDREQNIKLLLEVTAEYLNYKKYLRAQ